MRYILPAVLLLALLLPSGVLADESDKTRVGDLAPDFEVVTVRGKSWRLSEMRGQVVVLNFFATWCPPCREELPHLQSDLWNARQDDARWTLLSVGREHSIEQLQAFQEEMNLDIPMGADPERKVYTLYADQMVPRTYVIDTRGKIVFQSIGFNEADVDKFKEAIEQALK